MTIYAGTSGYSYKEWKGVFYPEKISPKDMLADYASKLPAVEINNTFYKLPRKDVLETWAEQVPDDFRFVLKASRRITHFKRLNDTGELLDYMFDAVDVLGKRLGVVFFQLPPNFKKDTERLGGFLDELPAEVPIAFEFRHETWFDDETFDLLRRHNRALCLADAEGDLDVPLVSTADWGYLRLRKPNYRKPELEKWVKWIGEQGWGRAYVFFKHEDEGAGPKMAMRFLELAGGS
jgi:uncharacterized protein YecE (DUF72 family)